VAQVTSFYDAAALARLAAGEHRWDAALQAYEKALELSDKPVESAVKKPGTKPGKAVKPDVKEVGAVREQLGEVKLVLAHLLYEKGNFAECVEATKPLVTNYKEGMVGSRAGALACRPRWRCTPPPPRPRRRRPRWSGWKKWPRS